MARHLQMVLIFYSNMLAAHKELYTAEIMIMMMVIYAAVGSLQPKVEQGNEYEIVDDESSEQDISVLPAENEDKKENLMSKLRKRLQSVVLIKKGLAIDSGAADHAMPLGRLIWSLEVASAGSIKGLHYVAASGT